MSKNKIINVQGHDVKITQLDTEDYISLTDMAKGVGDETVIYSWMRNRNTLEFLGLWEAMNNRNFKPIEFDRFRKDAGLNSFTMSPKKWVDSTNAVGIFSKAGRTGGGTYAHKDIAFEFGSWISPQFKLYLIKEFQRLKEIETNQYNLEWNVKRVVSKANYVLHTDAIKNHVLPKLSVPKNREWLVYASEADLLNVAVFGTTAQIWKEANPKLHLEGSNIRDNASINELAVLSNIESLNSILNKKGVDKKQRFELLQQTAKDQLASLNSVDFLKAIKKTSDGVYVDALEEKKSEFDKTLEGILTVPKPPKDKK